MARTDPGIGGKIGAEVLRLRKSRGQTLEQLATHAAVSKSMISKIERGQVSPSAAILGRLAEALEVGISDLLGAREASEVILIRAADQPVIRDDESGFERRCISPIFPARGVEIVFNTLPKGASTGIFVAHRHGVEEHIHVAKGRIRATLGDHEHILEAGDSLYFQAHVEHRFDNLADGESTWHLIIDSSKLKS